MRTVPEIRAEYNIVAESRKHVCTDGEVTQEDFALTPGNWSNKFCHLRLIKDDGTLAGIYSRCSKVHADGDWFDDVGVLLEALEDAEDTLNENGIATRSVGMAEFLTSDLKR